MSPPQESFSRSLNPVGRGVTYPGSHPEAMATKYAYVTLGDTAWVKLGSKGIQLYIATEDETKKGKESMVGKLMVGKAGIRWLPKGRKGKGAKIEWWELDNVANRKLDRT